MRAYTISKERYIPMSNIRKEYLEYKHFKEEIFKEAAELWTEDNVILINERLNRNAIYRLNSAIERFDKKFGPYRDKLPAIANILSNAETGLHLVITGKVGSRTTAQMLQRMSIMYNILSNFFGGDLAALLRTPAFRAAHEQPDEKIDKIVDNGHDIKAIRRTLASALKPSDEERMLFRRAYKSFDMPTLDWNAAAKQLCCLSCNELKDLTGVERVPMVVVDTDDAPQSEEGLEEAGVLTAAAGALIGGAATNAVQGASNFAKTFQKHGEQMGKSLAALEKIIYGIPELASLKSPMTRLRDKAQKASATRSGVPSFDFSAGVRGFMMHPTVVIYKQAIMVLESFEAILKAWDQTIEGNYSKSGFTKENLQNLKKELTNAVKGDMFSKIARTIMGGVKPFPGLSPNDIVNAFMKVAEDNVAAGAGTGAKEENQGENKPVTESLNNNNNYYNLSLLRNSINQIMLNEDFQALKNLIDKLKSFETSAEGKTEDVLTNDLKKIAAQKPGAGAQKQQPANKENVPNNPEEEADKIPDITEENINAALSGLERLKQNDLTPETIQQFNDLLKNSGLPGVGDVNSIDKMIRTYQAILVKDKEIKQLIDMLEAVEVQAEQMQQQANKAGTQQPAAPAPAQTVQ
jgi:hypothetical protein